MSWRLVGSLAMMLAGVSCTPGTKQAEPARDDAKVGSARTAISSPTATATTIWHEHDGACVCAGMNGGGYTQVHDHVGNPRSQAFTESLPPNARVTGIKVVAYGGACEDPTVTARIDGITIGTLTPGSACACDACVMYELSLTNPAGIPGFVIGANHTLELAVGSAPQSFLPSTVDVVFTYEVEASTTTLSSTTNPAVFGQTFTLTAHVAAAAGSDALLVGKDVRFVADGATVATAPINGAGDATLTLSGVDVGSYDVYATFEGYGFEPSSSGALTQVIARAATSTSLGLATNPAIVGESNTLTAAVAPTAPGAGTTTGTVTFYDGASVFGIAPVVNGSAVIDISSLGVGDHTFTATYDGDSWFEPSSATSFTQHVVQDGTTTSVVAGVNPSTFGSDVTFTATVSSNGTGGVPTGDVTFSEGSTVLGTARVAVDGTASLTYGAFAAGSHSVVATYGGDGNHEGGSYGSVEQVVQPATTETALETSVSPARHGQVVTLTATVSSLAPGALEGTVTFKEGGNVLGASTVSGGKATLVTSALTTGTHAIAAFYGGIASFHPSASSALTQVVGAAETTTSLLVSSNPARVGASLTFTASVAAVSPGAGVPHGTVTFKEGVNVLGTGVLSGGETTFTTSALALGTHPVVAEYAVTTDFGASTSSATPVVISAHAATAALTSAPSPSKVKAAVVLTATLSADGGVPSGDVTFVDSTSAPETTLGVAGLDGGVATLSLTTLDVGVHALHARYAGDSTYGPTVAETAHLVTKVSTTTTVGASPNPSEVGQVVTLTATVGSELAGATGNVDFFDGTVKLGSAALSGGSPEVAIAVSTLSVGGHVVSAVYGGDALHEGSTSASFTENVGQDAGANEVADAGKAAPVVSEPRPVDAGATSADTGASSSATATPVRADVPSVIFAGSGGCSTAPGSSPAVAAPFLGLLAAFAMRRRRGA